MNVRLDYSITKRWLSEDGVAVSNRCSDEEIRPDCMPRILALQACKPNKLAEPGVTTCCVWTGRSTRELKCDQDGTFSPRELEMRIYKLK